jgi:hypothetical protein
MIPTRHKSKLPKALSWPLGAEAISTGLADARHAADLSLSFTDSPVWPASAFQRLLREALPYAIFVADYRRASRPGYGGATALVESGWYDARWELRVNPVPRALRAAAGAVLREQGLPAVAEWLRSSVRAGWESQNHRIELVFAPADGTLTPQFTEGM